MTDETIRDAAKVMAMTVQQPVMPLQPARLESISDVVEIAPGVWMPRLGLGTSQATGDTGERAIRLAFDLGYRLVDTATAYQNERQVGRAVRESAVPREEVFITTKVRASDQGYQSTLRALEESLGRLGLDYVDLYLIHWPETEKTTETWRAMEDLHEQGLVRSIGVSNFEPDDLEVLFSRARIRPAVNQFEFHPWRQRPRLVQYCAEHRITVQAWAPVMRGRASQVRELAEIGHRHDKTGAQVSIRWILQKGITTIPKSGRPDRLRENADVFDFELSEEEMREIDALDRNEHTR